MATSRTNLFFKLNMLFHNQAGYDQCWNALKSDNPPIKYKDFKIVGNQLIYTPLNLRVVPTSEVESVLEHEYKENGTGRGFILFFIGS